MRDSYLVPKIAGYPITALASKLVEYGREPWSWVLGNNGGDV
jgi:hypothetical protein